MEPEETKRPRVKLIGEDGNAFNIIKRCKEALRREHGPDVAEAFQKEAMSGDYDHLLATATKYCEVH